ncbi:DUF5719 family protein [Alloscardovia venturai]|uniref:DUF5719 family protein n=1 Tax=Alloscardovia venturai TaxID=1769421 RepID=A0ABW2Y3S5_9BIFI
MPTTRALSVLRVTGATLSALALLGAGLYMSSGATDGWMKGIIPSPSSKSTTTMQNVAQQTSSLFCPAGMTLADDAKFGDSDYQATAGDLKSASRVAGIGALYQAEFDDVNQTNTKSLILDGATMNAQSLVTDTSDASTARTLTTRTLKADRLTGGTGSVVSWATTGDVRGVSAAQCTTYRTRQAFLIPATNTGWSQRLVVANSSDKPTSITLHAWGTKSGEELNLATNAKATVDAHSTMTVDLSAALNSAESTYVQVIASGAPVATIIQAIHMNGLTPLGSEDIMPLNAAATNQVVPGVSGVSSAQLNLFASTDTQVRLTYITDKGKGSSRTVHLTAHRVYTVTLDDISEGTKSILLDSTSAVQASAFTQVDGQDGQTDFAISGASQAYNAYAVTLPDDTQSTIDITNTSPATRKAKIVAYGSDGKSKGEKEITISAHSVASFNVDDFGDGVVFATISQSKEDKSSLVVGQNISVKSLADAHIAARATLTCPSMELNTIQFAVTHAKTVLN